MKKFTLFAILMLVASFAAASNTGFKLNYPMTYVTGTTQTNYVSLPYFYFPQGVGTAPSAGKVCKDAGGSANLVSVQNYVTANDVPQSCVCSDTSASGCVVASTDFAIVAGQGIMIKPKQDFTFNIVGSHDDDYSVGGSKSYPLYYSTTTTNTNVVSVPYHSKSDMAGALCKQLTSTKIVAIQSYITANDVPKSCVCSDTSASGCVVASTDFSLTPGLGVAMKPRAAAVTIQIDHY